MSTTVSGGLKFSPQLPREDPLAHLPRSAIVEYKKKRVIYSEDRPSTGLYLIVDGKVKVCRIAIQRQEVVVEIYRAGDFFGESALVGTPPPERATAMEDTMVMTWSTAEIESTVGAQPRLAVALWQILVQRTTDLGRRIESFSFENVAHRLARSLIRCSERLGSPADDGSIQMTALTHELLAQYVGTSREIVTHHMNHFRRKGLLRYSHKEINLNRDALTEWLLADTGSAAVP